MKLGIVLFTLNKRASVIEFDSASAGFIIKTFILLSTKRNKTRRFSFLIKQQQHANYSGHFFDSWGLGKTIEGPHSDSTVFEVARKLKSR